MPLCREIVASPWMSHVVVMGETSRQIREQLEEAGYANITRAYSMEDAVTKARELALSGGNVLLSPACASFDAFKNYKERGMAFRAIIEQY
jgi:UDP-N-acetylmuramoylalanine--D-glutamate ligase